MHNGEYLLPVEVVALLVFLFAPALLLAFIAQTYVFAAHRMFVRGFLRYAVLGYLGTIVGGLLIAAAILKFVPKPATPFLHIRNVIFVGQSLPVMPLPFITVGAASILVTWWIVRHTQSTRPNPSFQRTALPPLN